MIVILLVIHIMVAIALVAVVLLQKSEGGALGMGGGGMSGFMTGRSTGNLLTRATMVLAGAFFATSVLLVVLSTRSQAPHSLIDQGLVPNTQEAPVIPLPPAQPSTPSAPLQK